MAIEQQKLSEQKRQNDLKEQSGIKIRSYLSMKTSIISCVILIFFTTAALAAKDKPVIVTTTKVELRKLTQEIPLSATAEPLQVSDVSSKIEGIVKEVFVEEGQWVKEGQRIMSLDRAIAELDVASAKARLDEAIAEHKDTLRVKNEYKSLLDKKAVPLTTFASAVVAEEAAKASIAREKAILQRQKEILSRHELVAPFEGMVAKKYVEVGQWVKDESPVIKLVALDRIRIRAFLPQRYFNKIDLNSKARIVFDALKPTSYGGKPTALVALGNERTRSFPLLIELDNSQYQIAPGMSAKAYIELDGTEKQVPMVHKDAILLKADGSRIVWKVIESEGELTVREIKLKLGRHGGEWIEVLKSPLKPGDNIVLLGNENLRSGQVVKLRSND